MCFDCASLLRCCIFAFALMLLCGCFALKNICVGCVCFVCALHLLCYCFAFVDFFKKYCVVLILKYG